MINKSNDSKNNVTTTYIWQDGEHKVSLCPIVSKKIRSSFWFIFLHANENIINILVRQVNVVKFHFNY